MFRQPLRTISEVDSRGYNKGETNAASSPIGGNDRSL